MRLPVNSVSRDTACVWLEHLQVRQSFEKQQHRWKDTGGAPGEVGRRDAPTGAVKKYTSMDLQYIVKGVVRTAHAGDRIRG